MRRITEVQGQNLDQQHTFTVQLYNVFNNTLYRSYQNKTMGKNNFT